jgi:DNA-binding response OmpR family regulator
MPKILVADDSIAVRKVAERLLTEAGLSVALAANGEEALAYLSKERPDIVISDVIMPDKSGYEVCAFVRGNAMLTTVPVLLISGIVNDEVTKQAESCHADGVLKKPFQGTSLKDRVLELLAKRQEAPPAVAPRAAVMSPEPDSLRRVSEEQLETYRQATATLKQAEERLQAETARSSQLAQRVAELEGLIGGSQEFEALLEKERQRSTQLEAQLAQHEPQLVRLPELEQALKAEQEETCRLRQEGQVLQKAASKVIELEAALHAERDAAAQLVQQLTGLEQAAAKAQEYQTQVVREEHRAAEFEQRAKQAESALESERGRVAELSSKLAEAERRSERMTELEDQVAADQRKVADMEQQVNEAQALLSMERDRNGALARRVSEAEQSAEQATSRFEELARKLGEIAGLASQIGNAKGRS